MKLNNKRLLSCCFLACVVFGFQDAHPDLMAGLTSVAAIFPVIEILIKKRRFRRR